MSKVGNAYKGNSRGTATMCLRQALGALDTYTRSCPSGKPRSTSSPYLHRPREITNTGKHNFTPHIYDPDDPPTPRRRYTPSLHSFILIYMIMFFLCQFDTIETSTERGLPADFDDAGKFQQSQKPPHVWTTHDSCLIATNFSSFITPGKGKGGY